MAKEDKNTPVGRSPLEGKDKVQGTEADIIGDRSHGTDQTGAAAPDQVDQAEINHDKMADGSLRDPRWPASGSSMKVLPPADVTPERAEELNKEYLDKKEEAVSSDQSPTMGTATQSQTEKGAVAPADAPVNKDS